MFKINLSPETRARLDAEHRELHRLYGLTDRWLGDAILQLAREARAVTPQLSPERNVYDDVFVCHLLPELARRLGVQTFKLSDLFEHHAPRFRALSDRQLRDHLAGCLRNIGSNRYYAKPGWALLLHDAANGNPVVFAIDRICPGDLNVPDPLTRYLAEIARVRGVPYDGRWTEEYMDYSDHHGLQPPAEDTTGQGLPIN